MNDVLVIGAGISGLAAAAELSNHGKKVVVLEARDRIGGRIHTVRSADTDTPIELGAEFVHGRPKELLELFSKAKAHLVEHQGTDLCWDDGSLSTCPENENFALLDELGDLVKEQGDMSFDDFLRSRKLEDTKDLRSYVEGFNAADAARIGIAALARQLEAEDEIEGSRAWHSQSGYDVLANYLAGEATRGGATFIMESPVDAIHWTTGEVEAGVTTGNEVWRAKKAIVTLPLGVLQKGAVDFTPTPERILAAADQMAMGNAKRIILVFRSRFWAAQRPDMRFVFASGVIPRTWWTQHPADSPILVGWIGGPLAAAGQESSENLLARSLRSLERIFNFQAHRLDAELSSWHYHDWQKDPFSMGAYSYVPVGAIGSSEAMANPVDDTLYFAGEHTDISGHWGTVHGAIRSGLRAAGQILKSGAAI